MSGDRDRVGTAVLWINGVVMGFRPAGGRFPRQAGPAGALQPQTLLDLADDDARYELWIPGEPPHGGVIELTREQWTKLAGRLRVGL